jgi:glycosyltransferase involved in cell wall biosynthesis
MTAENKKKRVIIFATAYYPLVGGAEVAVKELTDRLVEYEFDLITARLRRGLPAQERIGRVNVYRLGWGFFADKYWLALRGGRFALQLSGKQPYDFAWAIMASYGAFAALDFSRRSGVHYLLTLQEGDDLKRVERKTLWWRKSFRQIFRQASQIQAISSYLADWARAMGATAPISVVPNGVNLDYLAVPALSAEELPPPTGGKVIISASRLVKKNGLADLVKALALLPPSIRLWLVGTGPEKRALQALAHQLRVTDRVTFLGFVDQPRLFAYLRAADIFVRPSLTEGLGNAFLEAMAVGLPTVGTPVGGIVDFLKDPASSSGQEATGWLVPVRNPAALARQIAFILDGDNQDEVKKISSQGKNLVLTKYSWPRIVSELRKIL